METKFQTSFIPKKQSVPGSIVHVSEKRTGSLFMLFAVIIFVVSLLGVGAAYGWQQYLTNQQEQYKQQLADREKQFKIDTIQELKQINVKIDTAKQILVNHIAVSHLFDIISLFTIANVRFTSMDVTTAGNTSDGVKISMSGYGTSLTSVAFQSKVFNQLEQYGLRNIVKNPILSDPSIDGMSGIASFGFTATIDPSNLSYKSVVANSLATTSIQQ